MQKGSTRVYGQIKSDDNCGELTGDTDILFPVEYELQPLWKILDDSKYSAQVKLFKDFETSISKKAIKCAEEKCTNNGVCKFEKDGFHADYTKDFLDSMVSDQCICNQGKTGGDCSQTFSEADLKRPIIEGEKYLLAFSSC